MEYIIIGLLVIVILFLAFLLITIKKQEAKENTF